MAIEVKHFSMCLMNIYIFSLEKFLFNSVVHFIIGLVCFHYCVIDILCIFTAILIGKLLIVKAACGASLDNDEVVELPQS